MDSLKIIDIQINDNRVNYNYDFDGKWKELLLDEKMFCEYDINLDNVPKSILIIPFLCNVLPISWVFNLTIEVDELDEKFADCIKDLKNGYQNMFPSIKMGGNILVKKVVSNINSTDNTGALFSGGVDAFNTLFQHMDEKPTLLTVWGADITLNDIEGWNKVKEHNIEIAKQFSLEYSFVKSNFRTFINYGNLSQYVRKFVNDEWWHGFQHGIGILGMMAPIAYVKGFKTLYIASSFTAEYKGKYTCASDPTIDNYLKFSSCKVVHDGYEFNRQDKIRNICNFAGKNNIDNVPIRVCWQSSGGENCCECEKCTRTIMGFLAEKKDPNKFGFNFTTQKRKKMIRNLKKYAKYSSSRYLCIQKKLCENYSLEQTPKDLIAFRKLKIEEVKPKYVIYFEKLIKLPYRIVRKIKHLVMR